MLPTRPGTRRAALASAFAICTATLQQSGQLVPGSRALTPRGAAKEGHARRHAHHGALVRRFERALANDGPPPALDRQVAEAAAARGIAANVHLSPPLRGERHNASPRLGELVARPGATSGWDARKHAVLAQLRTGEFRVEAGAGGPHLSLPDGATFGGFPTYPNDAGAGAAGAQVAHAAFDDPVYGSWGVVLDGHGLATLYRYLGRLPFDRFGVVGWLAKRGRFDAAHLPAPVHPRVLDGLARALLAHDAVREPLVGAVHGMDAFLGDATQPPTLADPRARAVYATVAASRCAVDKASAHRVGTRASREALTRMAQRLAVSEAVLRDVCGQGREPVPAGSACDVALDALARSARRPCDAPVDVDCPHRVSPATLAEWRGGAMPPRGPYETPRPHAPGAVPRCFYHPDTQRRLALQADVIRRVTARDPAATEGAIQAAVARAEAEHPLAETWARLDAEARAGVDDVAVSAGAGGDAGMGLLRRFYDAARGDDYDAARALWNALARDLNVAGTFEDFYALDAPFWDTAHRAAHDARNPGWLKWVHDQMRARHLTVHCGKGRGRAPSPALRNP